jgi:hypothetical protein
VSECVSECVGVCGGGGVCVGGGRWGPAWAAAGGRGVCVCVGGGGARRQGRRQQRLRQGARRWRSPEEDRPCSSKLSVAGVVIDGHLTTRLRRAAAGAICAAVGVPSLTPAPCPRVPASRPGQVGPTLTSSGWVKSTWRIWRLRTSSALAWGAGGRGRGACGRSGCACKQQARRAAAGSAAAAAGRCADIAQPAGCLPPLLSCPLPTHRTCAAARAASRRATTSAAAASSAWRRAVTAERSALSRLSAHAPGSDAPRGSATARRWSFPPLLS